MAAVNLRDLARMTVSSSGTGTITLNAAVSGFLTFDLAGCSTAAAGEVVRYAVSDTTQSEIAYGTYTSSALTLTRGSSTNGMKSTNSNSPINMSISAQVLITPQSRDFVWVADTANATAASALALTINNTLNATGATTLSSALSVAGTATFSSTSASINTSGTINSVTLDNTAWTSYTPAYSSTGGSSAATGTTVTTSGAYKVIGKTVFAWCTYSITTLGTASGDVNLTFPAGITPARTQVPGSGVITTTDTACVAKISTIPSLQFVTGASSQSRAATFLFEMT